MIKKDAALAAVDEQHEVALKKLDIYKTKIANTGNKLRNLRASAAVVNLAPGSATSGELWLVDLLGLARAYFQEIFTDPKGSQYLRQQAEKRTLQLHVNVLKSKFMSFLRKSFSVPSER